MSLHLFLGLLALPEPGCDAPGVGRVGRLIGGGDFLAIKEDLRGAVGSGTVFVCFPVGSLFRGLLFGGFLSVALFVFAPVVIGGAVSDEAVCDTADQEPPEQVHSLETSKQRESNDLRDPALVLLCLPIELVGADGFEFGENGVKDA